MQKIKRIYTIERDLFDKIRALCDRKHLILSGVICDLLEKWYDEVSENE